MGVQTRAVVLQLDADCRAADDLAEARGLKAYAGSAPITIASGKSEIVRHRRVKNQRLAAAGYVWIFGALRDPAIKAHYGRRRARRSTDIPPRCVTCSTASSAVFTTA